MTGTRSLTLLAAALGLWTAVTPAAMQAPSARRVVSRPVVVPAGRHDVSAPLREVAPQPPQRRIPHPPLMMRQPKRELRQFDPVLQTSAPTAVAPNTVVNFEGVNNVDGVLPPDTNGDIGPNHYVQWVNTTFAVYSRTGSLLYGPAAGSTLWSGFGGPCESRNDGDPIVLYDHLADRWILSQFALPNNFLGLLFAPFYQCIAISQTPDPTGAYYRYQYQFSKLNDYPKFGVWPDGYYMAINQFTPVNLQFAGQGVAAFDRAAMLAGRPASMVYFDLAGVDPNLGGMLPSDLDGPPPPAGSPNYFVQMDDDAFGYSPDQLQLWKFQANWTTPSASTFTGPFALPVAAFDSNLCAYARACIPQPGTTARLDTLADRLMYRLQYRNFGTHQSLVVNHTVDVDGSDHAGVRWYEIRNPDTAPVIHQQGTYAPDALHRWMGSAAMDAAGNLAIAYNAGGPALAPSIRYAARLASDPPGALAQGENDLITGSGSQTHGTSRWGDYSMLSVDPIDGCTFWATAEYFASTSPAGWQTRIGAFRLPGCGAGTPPPDAPDALTASARSSARIDLAWVDRSANETGFAIERCTGNAASCAASASFTQVGQTAAGTATFVDGNLQAGTAYSYRVRAFNSGGTSAYSNLAEATTYPPPSITVNATIPTATEAGQSSAVLTISRGAAEDSALVVNYSIGGTALNGTDYQPLATSVTIPAGSASATVTVLPVDDALIEPNETVVLTLTASSAYVAGTPSSATVTIVSDDLSIDLYVMSLTAPAAARAGGTIDVAEVTRNQGLDASGPTVTSFYLSADYSLDAKDVPLGTRAVPSLAAGATSSATTTLTLPSTLAPGQYVVVGKADGPGEVRETNEYNNMRYTATKVGPDLTVLSLAAPASAGAGIPFAVTETTKNMGAEGAGASTTRFYLSVNHLLDSGDTPLQARSVAALEGGAASSATTMVTLPPATAVGTYYLLANADDGDVVVEHTETNNTKYVSIRIGGDLVVTALTVPSQWVATGATIVATDTTKNTGADSIGSSTTAFYLSSNSVLDAGDTRLEAARAVAALAPGESSTGATAVTLGAVLPGRWYLIANADEGNLRAETSETNNTRSALLFVGPDLFVYTVAMPLTATAGSSIAITDTVRNGGGEAAGPSATRFYLSRNSTLDAGDVPLAARDVPVVAANGSNSGTTTVVLPAGISGQHYVIAVADGFGAVAESSETNNVMFRGIMITAPASPEVGSSPGPAR